MKATVVSKERSRLMSSVKQAGTSVETDVKSILDELGLRFETNVRELPGSPDFANREDKWAVFAHGCYWHAHEGCSLATVPKTNSEFWIDKFEKNKTRDRKKTDALHVLGYAVQPIWQCELNDRHSVKENITRFIQQQARKPKASYGFERKRMQVTQSITFDGNSIAGKRIQNRRPDCEDARDAYDYSYLRIGRRPSTPRIDKNPIKIVDLFCGCGGLSLGAIEACRTFDRSWDIRAAIDLNSSAMKVYKKNITNAHTIEQDILERVDGELGTSATTQERSFVNELGPIDILLAGPPCQGYSDLNNHTRRKDERNLLYERVARFVELSKPRNVLIENVPTVRNGKEKALLKTIETLGKAGYSTSAGVVDLASLGVPQKRRRHVLLGSLDGALDVMDIAGRHSVVEHRSVRWAIEDLEDLKGKGIFDSPSDHNASNKKRLQYLIDKNLYDLPNRMRPDCHKDGDHSYTSVYGRLDWNEPAQTITGGFGSPGQGRFGHPSKPRTLTPHEAARLQFFPDYFSFSSVERRTALAEMIGNAVPMKLSYAFCLEFLAKSAQNRMPFVLHPLHKG